MQSFYKYKTYEHNTALYAFDFPNHPETKELILIKLYSFVSSRKIGERERGSNYSPNGSI